MKKFTAIFSAVVLLLNIFSIFTVVTQAASNSVTYTINANSTTGSEIKNIVGYMNSWGYENLRNLTPDGLTDHSFVEYVEIMTATGGSSDRDLIDANGNMITSKLNALAQGCRGVLNMGAKPLLKLGCIPFYFSMRANPNKQTGGSFGYNVSPPDDDKYGEYQTYLENVIRYLVDVFGIDEVRTWRFGVMTEYENDEWFYVKTSSGKIDANATKLAFFKIYDHSVAALENVLGKEYVYVGAHSMTVTEGIWDERDFIDHVAQGYNYATGSYSGVRLDYLSVSFYDLKPEKYTSGKTLAESINFLRSYACSKGLTNLNYGIDEGRILYGVNSGAGSDQLNTRCVGHLWQAGYDARMYKTMIDEDIDYFCVWSWTSDGIGTGYPTISHHVAESVSKMATDKRLNVVKNAQSIPSGVEAETVASFDEESQTMKFFSYTFKNDLSYYDQTDMSFIVKFPQLAGKNVKVKCSVIDNSSNYFDEWWEDRNTYGITGDKFNWSPDDPTIDSWMTLADPEARTIYQNNLRSKYIECSKLNTDTYVVSLDDTGSATLHADSISGNAVVYFEVSPSDALDTALVKVENLNRNLYMDISDVDALTVRAYDTGLTQEERNALAAEIEKAIGRLVTTNRLGSDSVICRAEVNYPYAYLYQKITVSKVDGGNSFFGSVNDDVGDTVYILDGDGTYDLNNFYVWHRSFENNNAASAVFYVDRYSHSNLRELGNIISANYTSWGKNHMHAIGIGSVNDKKIDGGYASATLTSSMGNNYTYSLSDFSANSQYSLGGGNYLEYTPEGALRSTSNSASLSGPVPQDGESITVRIGSRLGVIDGYNWGNYINFYCWTDITVIGYDSTVLRNAIMLKPGDPSQYTPSSYAEYEKAYNKAVYVLNNSYDKNVIEETATELNDSFNSLERISDILRGDVNLDGSINGMDAVLVNCIVSGMLTENDIGEIPYIAADINTDGMITSDDSEIICNYGILVI